MKLKNGIETSKLLLTFLALQMPCYAMDWPIKLLDL